MDSSTDLATAAFAAACIPAAVLELVFGEGMEELFYNYQTVSIMLIVVGVLFILIENWNKDRRPEVEDISGITYRMAVYIGIFQLAAALIWCHLQQVSYKKLKYKITIPPRTIRYHPK